MKRFPLLIILTLFLLLCAFITDSDTDNLLFKIERSKDANQIFYTVNTDDNGSLKKNPITVFWIKRTKHDRIEPLTWIQKKYAYGLNYLHCCKDYATFQFVSYDKTNFILKKVDDEFKVFTQMHERVLEVERIYIQIDGGTFWVPNVTEVQLYALDMKSGKKVIESIQP